MLNCWAADCALDRSLEAMAWISDHRPACIAGMTFLTAMLATPRTPHLTFCVIDLKTGGHGGPHLQLFAWRLPVDDVIDGRSGSDILQGVELIRRIKNHGTRSDLLPLAIR